MVRGRRPDPNRAPAGTSHHPAGGEQIVEYVPQAHSSALVCQMADSLPTDLARDVFARSIEAMGDRLTDNDVYALRRMAVAFDRSVQADLDIEKNGLMYVTEWGRKVNPAAKLARDESNHYLKIADQYGLTFLARLRAGILQLAGQSMMSQIHESMASAIVSRILELDPLETIVVENAIDAREHVCVCGRDFPTKRGLSNHKRYCKSPKKKRRKR